MARFQLLARGRTRNPDEGLAAGVRAHRSALLMATAILGGLIPSLTAGIERATVAHAASPYAQSVMGDNPISYWRLNDTGTTAADQTGKNNGSIQGRVTPNQPGPTGDGAAMKFDGSTGWLQLTPSASLEPAALTWEAWVETSDALATTKDVSRLRCNVAPNCGYSFGLPAASTGNGAYFATWDSTGTAHSCTGGPLLNDGKWHYIAGTQDSATMHLYVDGALVQSCANTSPILYGAVTGAGFARDADNPDPVFYWNGALAEIAVYGSALTSQQISNHYQAAGAVVPPSGPPITTAEVPTGENFCWRCYAKRTVEGSRAEPVSTATGAFYENFTDLSIPGRGLPIAVTRTYSSARASSNGPLGFGWTHGYAMSLSTDPSGNATITGPDGSQTVFTLSGTTYTGPPRAESTLVKNSDGTYTFTQNLRTTYTFNASGQLTQEKDLNGYVTSLAYNPSGQLSTLTDPANRAMTLGYSGSNVTSVIDPMSRKVIYGYDGSRNLSSVTDVNGGVTKFTYDANHLLLTVTDPRNNVVTTNHYDASQRVDWQTDGLNRKTTFAYSGTPFSSAGGSTTVTDPKGNVTVDQYTYGERTAITRGSGTPQAATWQYRYDPGSLGLSRITDPLGHVTAYMYDANGNRTLASDPLLRTTQDAYDGLDDLTSTTDANGITTTFTYDSKGNLLSRSTPLVGSNPAQTQTTTYTYGDSAHPGDVTAVTDPDGKVSHTSYDANGDVVSTTDPLGDQTTMAYNSVGWITTMVSPRGNATGGTPSQFTTTYSYADPSSGVTDEFGDVRVITDPLGDKTTNSYDPDRSLVSVQDSDSNLTQYTFDAANEPTDVTRADGTKLHIDFFPDGTVQDQLNGAGNKTSYTYDPLAHLASVTDPLTNVTSYAADALGTVLTKTDPGGSCTATPKVGCTTYAHDAANQLTSITYSDGTTPNVTGITYDADGQRTAMTDGTGASAWSWDSLHRIMSYTNGAGTAVSFAYNLRGLETSITYPGSHMVTQGFDDVGRLTSVQDWLGNTTSFGYDADSDLTSETFPTTGTVDTFSFDRADRMMSVSDASGVSTPFSAVYTRDANGQVTADTSAATAQGAYHYTALNQVCYAALHNVAGCTSPPPKAQTFAYDAADNLTQIGSTQQAFNADSELCWTGTTVGACASPPTGATTYSYDTRGNRTKVAPASGTATTLGYDQANRLSTYSPTATYAYNGDGLRMSKAAGGSTSPYVWNVSASLPLLLQDATTNYVYGPGGLPLEQVAGSTVLYYHHDQLGSTRLLTNSSGGSAATYTFDVYGNLTATTGNATNPFLYAGQYRDAETGFYYLRSRYYDPATAQFLTRDPVASMTGEPYAYTGGNPVNRTDPSGLYYEQQGWVANQEWCDYLASPGEAAEHCPGSSQPALQGYWGSITVGFCVSGTAGEGLGATGSACLASTTTEEVLGLPQTENHLYVSGGGGLTTGEAGVGVSTITCAPDQGWSPDYGVFLGPAGFDTSAGDPSTSLSKDLAGHLSGKFEPPFVGAHYFWTYTTKVF